MITKKHLYWVLYLLFFISCARQTSPTGGPKDTLAPILVKPFPPDQEINYKSSQIQLNFNELVALNNPKEQIMITPEIGKEYDIVARGKQVTLTLKNKLKDSTTYSINFRDAVKDVTEKNPAINLKIALSTGSYIDSLSIKGTTYSVLKGKEIKETTVALYQSDTFNIFYHTPAYITKSDAKGFYIIENLKPGKYFIYAVDDNNRNLMVDSKTEAYGFRADSINLSSNKTAVDISTFRLDARPLKLTNSRPYNTYFNIKTSKNLAHYKIKTLNGAVAHTGFGEDYANIKVYNTFQEDSTALNFQARDSVNNSIDTVLYAKFSQREVKKESFTVIKEDFQVISNKGIIKGKVRINKPIFSINYDSIYYKIDSLRIVNFTQDDFTVDSLHNILYVSKKIDRALLLEPIVPEQKERVQLDSTKTEKTLTKKKIDHQLYFGVASFISIELDSSKKIEEKIKPSTLEETGVITTRIETTQLNFIVELLDKYFNVIQTIYNNKKAAFEDLSPGDYQLRLIIDKNKDGKWSPGNFFLKQETEPIIFYKNEKGSSLINLKANWELGPLLITN